MATIGTILIQAANQAGSITGPNAPSIAGGGSSGDDLRSQKKREEFEKKNLEQGEKAPKFWTAAFKKMGIQMGLAGILKQSQIFTSTIGSIFQIFGAFVDVILAPFVPLFIPAIRWLARQLPTVAKAAQWTADKLAKGVSAVWNFLTNGKMWSNVGNFFKDMASAVWDKIGPVLEPIGEVFKTIGSKISEWILQPIKDGMQWLWNNSLGGWKVSIGSVMGKSLSFRFPTWGGGGAAGSGGPDVPSSGKNGDSNTDRVVQAIDGLKDKVTGGGGGLGDAAIAGGIILGGGTAINTATTSVKLGQSSKWRNSRFGGRNPNLDMPKGWKQTRTGVGGWVDDVEMNPLRRIPGARIANTITKPIAAVTKAPLKIAKNLLFGGVDDMAQVATPMRVTGPSAPRKTPNWAMGPDAGPSRMPTGASFGDDLAQMKGTGPTKLSRAVNAFNQWVKKTTPKLKNAAGAGARAFQNVYDEGFSLADDVVKLAKVTPGMGVVGKIVSVGFKRVIPGIAGAYMVGETIQDVWKIVKSDAPWLGDWKSLDAYKAEAMGALFGGKASLLGGGLNILGWGQEKLGLGSNISDWQDQITKNQKEKGVLSSGKLMDAIIRGTTGIGGAALSTFFPGLGTLAGTALYEGGRYATTGVNVPGLGQLGGDVEKYGAATDFSDTIIKAIESGWGKGVNMVEIR